MFQPQIKHYQYKPKFSVWGLKPFNYRCLESNISHLPWSKLSKGFWRFTKIMPVFIYVSIPDTIKFINRASRKSMYVCIYVSIPDIIKFITWASRKSMYVCIYVSIPDTIKFINWSSRKSMYVCIYISIPDKIKFINWASRKSDEWIVLKSDWY